ncbi:MAG: DUF308 domain-containing protein [Paramuribaculum sp.]|nr:DUF308 domain-containing protein [Paramuribaculum sp.]
MKLGNNWFTAVIVFIVGVALIVLHSRLDVLSWLVRLVGCMLVIPSVCNLILQAVHSVKHKIPVSASVLILAIASLALGIWMLATPAFFVNFFSFLLGAILIVYGIIHIIIIARLNKEFVMPFWFYVIPLLMIVAGVVIVATDIHTKNEIVVLIMGIALISSSVNTFLELYGGTSRNSAAHHHDENGSDSSSDGTASVGELN